jgi:hypothetical protein
MDLGLLHGFITVIFSGVESLAPRQTPNLEDRDYSSSDAYPFTCLTWVALLGTYAPVSIAPRVTEACKYRLQHKAVVLVEEHIHNLDDRWR